MTYMPGILETAVLSCFSHVQLFATLWTIVCQAVVRGIPQARILECVAISYSRVSSQSRDQTHVPHVSCTGKQILYHCTTWEALMPMVNGQFFKGMKCTKNENVVKTSLQIF